MANSDSPPSAIHLHQHPIRTRSPGCPNDFHKNIIPNITSNLTSNLFLLSRPPNSRTQTCASTASSSSLTSSSSLPSFTINELDSPPSSPATLPKSFNLIRFIQPSNSLSLSASSPPLPASPTESLLSSPLTLPPSPFHHRRHVSQPTTPVPVKETFHGSLSELGLDHGQRKLNQYLLLKTIGRGSFGSVELAQDTSSPGQELYAIKEYSKSRMRKRARILDHRSRPRPRRPPPTTPSAQTFDALASPTGSLQQSSEGMELVKAEVAIMKKLAHPNIVTLLEVIDTDDDSLFFVLELCKYGPVMQVQLGTAVPPLSEARARGVFRQVLLGIEYLHFNQIIHRDIKPDNILYAQDPALFADPLCKIVDFGVSESFSTSGDDRMHKSAGSPAFLAPEMCSGSGQGIHGKIADIWAMGVTLYAMVCGRLPFEDSSPITLCEKIMNDTLEVPQELSGSLKALLERLLDKNPDTRIQIDELRNDAWVTEDGTEPLPTAAQNLTPIEPPTEREIAEAFKSMGTFATMLKAVSRFRAKRRSRSTQSGSSEADVVKGTFSGDQLVDSPLGSVVGESTSSQKRAAGPLKKLSFEARQLFGSQSGHHKAFSAGAVRIERVDEDASSGGNGGELDDQVEQISGLVGRL